MRSLETTKTANGTTPGPPWPPAEECWVREPELRAYFRFSKDTIKRLRRRGLPSVGRYRLRRYPPLKVVVEWLREHAS
jgi:hypothetical protein